jgi:hypothetical protein
VDTVTVAIDIFHQQTAAWGEGTLLTVACGDLDVTVQADHELALGWMNTLTGPAAGYPDELKPGLESVRHEQRRCRRPVVGFLDREFVFGEVALPVLSEYSLV